MKGVVFTGFVDMVEEGFGIEMVDYLIDETKPPSGGAYTATGTYSHHELVAMVIKLGEKTGTPVSELIRSFGNHLFGLFKANYPAFFLENTDGWSFLKSVDSYIHVEVRKLYPDAELPRFECRDLEGGGLEMVYNSARCFEELALGMIEGCMEHFGHAVDIKMIPIEGEGGGTVFRILPAVCKEG